MLFPKFPVMGVFVRLNLANFNLDIVIKYILL